MTKEERLELLKQIEKDIHVCSIESTFLDDAKSCAIHSVIEELEQEPTTKNDLGVDTDKLIADCEKMSFDFELFGRPTKALLLDAVKNIVKDLPSVTPQEPVLDKIRAEIEQVIGEHKLDDYDYCSGLICARRIIDKYKGERTDNAEV